MALQHEPFGLPWLNAWKPPQLPQMRAMGSLVHLILILSCSRSLYHLLWKPHEIMWVWVLCTTQSWSSGLVRFGVPAVGKIQTETQQVELKERKHEVTWLNYETVTFCCDSEFTSSSGIVMCPNSERMVLQGVVYFMAESCVWTHDMSNLCPQITSHKSCFCDEFNTTESKSVKGIYMMWVSLSCRS